MKKFLLIFMASGFVLTSFAQSLDKMTWFNEPGGWSIKGNTLTMDVTPHSDYWRISHYGFTVDDAPFYYENYGEGFKAKFDNFSVKHLPDQRRLEWLADHAE